MAKRYFADWLSAFIEYAKFGEAPTHMYFWCGVAAVAGALRRKVWIDQAYFKWHCNQYIILVAPPGIVSKSTTAGTAMNLLRKVPGIHFGPDVVTWQALVGTFSEATETFLYNGEHYPMSAVTLESSEFGNLLNPQDKDMVDLLVSLWDGKQGVFDKRTKHSGNDKIENPWINLIACTTPAWIAGNFPEYMIGGGFTSRCLFVYADKKARYVAYPGLDVPNDLKEAERKLVHDLEHISIALMGEYKLDFSAVVFGKKWYQDHYEARSKGGSAHLDDERFGGYVARKQTHIHKLAMILAASSSDDMIITTENLQIADKMITDLELEMPFVFSKIGRTEVSVNAERLMNYIEKRGKVSYQEAYRYIHAQFPSMRDFEDVLSGCVRAGYLKMNQVQTAAGPAMMLESVVPQRETKTSTEGLLVSQSGERIQKNQA